MINVPNVITLARLALVPVVAYLLWEGAHGPALVVFLAAALSDFFDGVLANTLVCLAVWLTYSARTTTDKVPKPPVK